MKKIFLLRKEIFLISSVCNKYFDIFKLSKFINDNNIMFSSEIFKTYLKRTIFSFVAMFIKI